MDAIPSLPSSLSPQDSDQWVKDPALLLQWLGSIRGPGTATCGRVSPESASSTSQLFRAEGVEKKKNIIESSGLIHLPVAPVVCDSK